MGILVHRGLPRSLTICHKFPLWSAKLLTPIIGHNFHLFVCVFKLWKGITKVPYTQWSVRIIFFIKNERFNEEKNTKCSFSKTSFKSLFLPMGSELLQEALLFERNPILISNGNLSSQGFGWKESAHAFFTLDHGTSPHFGNFTPH